MKIETRLAERLKKVKPSSTLAITSKAKKLKAEGRDVVSFAAGEPDFDTPDFVKQAAIEAINAGFTKYTPTTGIPELKKAVCDKFRKDNGLEYVPEQVVVSCGAKHSIFNALFVLAEKGDEVLIPSPYWVSYPEMTNLCGATPRFIKTDAENGFKMTLEDLERNLSAGAKVLILNSPSNPTGSVYSAKELQEIAKLCVAKKVFVISDEIYEKIMYDGVTHTSIASFGPEIYDLTITVNGLSKSHSMTGWRIGYMAGPKDVMEAVSKVQDHTTSNPASMAQKAALAALTSPDDFGKKMAQEFQKRRDCLIGRVQKIPKMKLVRPQGAFYLFCDISKTGMGSVEFATRLLDEEYVAVIPGDSFGADEFVRFSFATSIDQINKGLDRIEKWIK